uniref:Uncharacterized protein n=1 Tax=Anguilla anguilla TaxID=7936 RepID=A0A0E9PZN3_ANGAN
MEEKSLQVKINDNLKRKRKMCQANVVNNVQVAMHLILEFGSKHCHWPNEKPEGEPHA